MTDERTSPDVSPRQRAIEAYDSTRERVSDTLSEAPLLALAGGIAAGALIAALLPRTKAETRASYDDGRAREVFFALDVSPIKDEYTLAYEWDGDREVTWTLVEGKMLRALDGAYELRESGAGTEVTYRLALDVSIPLIGMLKRKGEKILIDTALKGLKKRVESLG